MKTIIRKEHPIVLFDGVCNLCNGFIQFCIQNDITESLKFASLQSDAGKQLLKEYQLDNNSLSTMIVIKEGKVYTKSDAPLVILNHFSFRWKVLRIFKLIPKILRDFIYDIVARNRYWLMGKQKSCWLPTPELNNRFYR